jgi:hypothetical protein
MDVVKTGDSERMLLVAVLRRNIGLDAFDEAVGDRQAYVVCPATWKQNRLEPQPVYPPGLRCTHLRIVQWLG